MLFGFVVVAFYSYMFPLPHRWKYIRLFTIETLCDTLIETLSELSGDKMKNEQYRMIVQYVGHANMFTGRDTGQKIATDMRNIASRATVYRWLKKAEKIGLLERTVGANKYHWHVTDMGYEFVDSFLKLPF